MDYIVNSILDLYLSKDPNSRVAIDGVVKNKFITLGGEITSNADISDQDIKDLIIKCTKDIGYDFIPEVTLHLYKQSPEIALGTNDDVGGAGDQGTITGYACTTLLPNVTIPLEKYLADSILRYFFTNVRKIDSRILSDMKSQVTLNYTDSNEFTIDTIVLAIQHTLAISEAELKIVVKEHLNNLFTTLKLPEDSYKDYNLIVNGTGSFIVGGPEADSGEVGRKIVVDAYGVSVPVGGGTYNGKDSTKVDRSAAYMARYVANTIVASHIASECLITVSYCIGLADPISIEYDFKGTNKVKAEIIEEVANSMFSFRPKDIIKQLNLKQPIYATSCVIGHFGNEFKSPISENNYIPTDLLGQVQIPWENTDKKEELLDKIMDKLCE